MDRLLIKLNISVKRFVNNDDFEKDKNYKICNSMSGKRRNRRACREKNKSKVVY